ncbi:MAG: hemolysin [Gammaproteobacteria bacterium BRH_c0]|nr:MAG: hemolysin [Gammaproteobacteria bacterium BRH_c0]
MLTTLIAFLLLATVLSFFCSLWESVLLSITPSYAQIKIQQGTALGVQLRAFKENIDRPLAAILTLNTVAHTVGAIGVGQEATKIWADTSPLITGLLVPGLTTIVILIFSEIIPKTIGATHWQRLATFTVYCLKYVIWLLFPLVWLCQFATRRFKVSNEASLFSRSDFLAMTEIGAQEGVFEHTHSEMIKSLLAFDTVVVKSIMTPRTVVHRVSEDTTIKDYFNSQPELPFSRIPLYEADRSDHITGYFLKDQLLAAHIRGHSDQPLKTILREITVAHESLPITRLFNQFLDTREHIALVMDEFGSMVGIITLEDIIETILGTDIVDETDNTENMQALARKRWLREAMAKGIDVSDIISQEISD